MGLKVGVGEVEGTLKPKQKARLPREVNHLHNVVVVVVLLFYVHSKHLRLCRDGQLTKPHFSWAGLDLLSG